MWDADLDRRVSRTKDRPITSGKLSQFDALVFLGGQLGTATLLLMTLDWYTVCLASSSMALVVTYPLMKRITYWPQLMLGTLKFQIEDTAQKKLIRLRKSTNYLETQIGHDIDAIVI